MIYSSNDNTGSEIEVENFGGEVVVNVYDYDSAGIYLNRAQVRDLVEALKNWLEE